MNVFGNNYARYYDFLYEDKDYRAEATYVHELIQKHNRNSHSILELGCGSGGHATVLAELGYELHGVDISSGMLEQAQRRIAKLSETCPGKLSVSRGDIRTIRIKKKFDVVISLFHVMSYQTTNNDLTAVFRTAKEHLKPNGIFMFDCWYGPAVLSDMPSIRVKRFENELVSITRIAEPIMHPNDNLVNVRYHLFIKDKINNAIEELKETHAMRYLFTPEVEFFANENGLTSVDAKEWMSSKITGFDTWSACFVLKA